MTALEWERLLEYSELFKKFLMKSKFNYQIWLSTGFFKWREQEWYRAMDVCDELCKSIDSIEKWFIEFNKKKEQK